MYSFATYDSGDPFYSTKPKPLINTNLNYTVTNQNNKINPLPTSLYKPLNATTSLPNMSTKVFNLINPHSNYNPQQTTTRRTFRPEDLKVNLLEEKIRQLEEKNKQDRSNYNDIIESGILRRQDLEKQIQNEMMNSYNNNIQNNNLRNRNNNLSEEEYNKRRLDRRNQVKFELNQARKLLHESSSEYSDEEEEEENENYEKQNLNNKNIKNTESDFIKRVKRNYQRTDSISSEKVNSEALDFINGIKNHPAFQLQTDNFKLRANVIYIKGIFQEIQNSMKERLAQLELQQKLNFESMRHVLERGGSNKLKASVLKNLDKRKINLNDVNEEVPEFINDLPDIIKNKLEENDRIRKEEQLREKLEENELRNLDEIFLPPIITGIVNGNVQNLNPNRVNYPKNVTNMFGYPKEEVEKKGNRKSIADSVKQITSHRRGSIGGNNNLNEDQIIKLRNAGYINNNINQSSSQTSISESSTNQNQLNRNKNVRDNKRNNEDDDNEEEEEEDDDNYKRRRNKNRKLSNKKKYKLDDKKNRKKRKNVKQNKRIIHEEEDEDGSDD